MGTKYMFKRGTPFWDRITQPAMDACWEWNGAHHPAGYGETTYNGRKVRAHRLAYTLAVGPIPEGLLVRHRCDNPPCCNPAHLLLGTYADNAADAVERGLWPNNIGENHSQAKFTDVDIAAMRAARAGGALLSEISERFGIEVSYASRVCSGAFR